MSFLFTITYSLFGSVCLLVCAFHSGSRSSTVVIEPLRFASLSRWSVNRVVRRNVRLCAGYRLSRSSSSSYASLWSNASFCGCRHFLTLALGLSGSRGGGEALGWHARYPCMSDPASWALWPWWRRSRRWSFIFFGGGLVGGANLEGIIRVLVLVLVKISISVVFVVVDRPIECIGFGGLVVIESGAL